MRQAISSIVSSKWEVLYNSGFWTLKYEDPLIIAGNDIEYPPGVRKLVKLAYCINMDKLHGNKPQESMPLVLPTKFSGSEINLFSQLYSLLTHLANRCAGLW